MDVVLICIQYPLSTNFNREHLVTSHHRLHLPLYHCSLGCCHSKHSTLQYLTHNIHLHLQAASMSRDANVINPSAPKPIKAESFRHLVPEHVVQEDVGFESDSNCSNVRTVIRELVEVDSGNQVIVVAFSDLSDHVDRINGTIIHRGFTIIHVRDRIVWDDCEGEASCMTVYNPGDGRGNDSFCSLISRVLCCGSACWVRHVARVVMWRILTSRRVGTFICPGPMMRFPHTARIAAGESHAHRCHEGSVSRHQRDRCFCCICLSSQNAHAGASPGVMDAEERDLKVMISMATCF